MVDLEDDARRELLGLSDAQLADVAAVCNRCAALCFSGGSPLG